MSPAGEAWGCGGARTRDLRSVDQPRLTLNKPSRAAPLLGVNYSEDVSAGQGPPAWHTHGRHSENARELNKHTITFVLLVIQVSVLECRVLGRRSSCARGTPGSPRLLGHEGRGPPHACPL